MQTASAAKSLPQAAVEQPPYRAIIETVLEQFTGPATPANLHARAASFIAAFSGAIGYHDKALGLAVFAVVSIPEPILPVIA